MDNRFETEHYNGSYALSVYSPNKSQSNVLLVIGDVIIYDGIEYLITEVEFRVVRLHKTGDIGSQSYDIDYVNQMFSDSDLLADMGNPELKLNGFQLELGHTILIHDPETTTIRIGGVQYKRLRKGEIPITTVKVLVTKPSGQEYLYDIDYNDYIKHYAYKIMSIHDEILFDSVVSLSTLSNVRNIDNDVDIIPFPEV